MCVLLLEYSCSLGVNWCRKRGVQNPENPKLKPQKPKRMSCHFHHQAKTTPIEIKAPSMATIKSNNYLPNALAQDDAEADPNATHGIFVDQDGYVSEGGTFNVAFITNDDELVVPTFDNSLAGTTILRIMELIPKVMRAYS